MSISKVLVTAILAGFSLVTSARAEIQVKTLLTQKGAHLKPLIVETKNRIVVAMDSKPDDYIYDPANLDRPQVLQRSVTPEHYGLAADPSGWVADCYAGGTKILLFNVSDPNRVRTVIDFEDDKFMHEHYIDCHGIGFQVRNTSWPTLVVGAMANQGLDLMQPNGDILMRLNPVPAVTSVQVVGENAFLNLGLVNSVPYVINLATHDSVVGDRFGKNERFGGEPTKQYVSDSFYDSKTDAVYYFKNASKEMMKLSASKPELATMQKFAVTATNPRAMSRIGNCLAILGVEDGDPTGQKYIPAYPQWTIVYAPDPQTWKELGTTDYLASHDLDGAWKQVSDDSGNLYITSWNGAYQISGVADGLGCQ